jgi:hypothetical protein
MIARLTSLKYMVHTSEGNLQINDSAVSRAAEMLLYGSGQKFTRSFEVFEIHFEKNEGLSI